MSDDERVFHCWEEGPSEDRGNDRVVGSTCMLLDGHHGPHEFTPDDEIVVSFADFPEDSR